MSRLALCAATVALVLGSITGVASAEPPETFRLAQVVPPETFLLFRVPDVAAVERGFPRTALSKIYHDEEVQEFVAPLLDMVRSELARLREREGFDLIDFLGCLRGEVGLALVDMDLSAGAPYPNLVVSVDARENRARLEKYLDEFLAKAVTGPQPATMSAREFRGVPIRVAEVGPHRLNGAFLGTTFVFATKPETMDKVILASLTGTGETLADSNLYTEAMAQVAGDGTSVLEVFVNGASIQASFAEFLKPYEAILTETGVAGIRAIALASHLDGSGFTDRLHVHAPGETRGLFKIASRKPLNREILRVVPSNAFHVSAGTMNLGAMWDEIMRVLATVQPDTYVDVAARIDETEKFLGFKLKDELIDSLGQDLLMYAAPPRGGGGFIPELVVSVELRDRAKFETCLGKAIVAARAEMGEEAFSRHRMEFRGHEIHYFQFSGFVPITPSFAFLDGRLVVSLMPQTIKGMIRAQVTTPSILDRDDVREAMARLPGKCSAVGFTDLRGIYNLVYNTALPFLQNIELGIDLPLDLALLPSAEAVSRHLEPAVSAAWADDSGVTWTIHTPVSLLTLLGPAVASVGMISGARDMEAAVEMEPGSPESTAPVRPPSRDIPLADQDVVNLKEIGTALVIYFVENGSYPKTLEDLVTSRLVKAEQLLTPGDKSPRVVGSVKTSYEYVGPGIGKLRPEQQKQAVLVWSRTPIRVVLFLDSPLPRRVPESRFQALLASTRARIGGGEKDK